jgi:hypothetical protein
LVLRIQFGGTFRGSEKEAMTGATATQRRALIAIKLLHTSIWGLHAACVVALPLLATLHLFRWAVILMVPVVLEVGVLAINRNRCPLRKWAERYIDDRSPNYDIYLQVWLAANTKLLFASRTL